MDLSKLCVSNCRTCQSKCFREERVPKNKEKILGFSPEKFPSKDEIVLDARRCIYCHDPPCGKCCPAQVNVRDFVHAAACENWYYAAKVILTSNPLPLSTGNLCCVSNFCQGGCNLNKTMGGPIRTNRIQLLSMRKFREYKIKPKVPESIGKKVAIVGAGPAGLSCAAFLRRFGIDVTIFEKEEFAGGLLMSELLPNRLPLEDLQYEIEMIKDMGVNFEFKKVLGKDFTVDSLIKEQKYDAVFLAFGKPDDVPIRFPCTGAMSSHEFLRKICLSLKMGKNEELPDYTGKKVLVLGAGETAIDCASAASRLGGEVTVAFRKDFKGMRVNTFDVEELMRQKVEFMPLASPCEINNGKVRFQMQEYDSSTNKYKALDEYITKQYDIVITAFGASLEEESKKLIPGKISQSDDQKVEGYDNVFIGGDLAGRGTVVEAVNDGKIGAKMIAEYLGIKEDIPEFKTEVDDVSLETTVDGLKYINPMGIASAPLSGTYESIRRGFEAGWGWVALKTLMLNKDLSKDNDLRITKNDSNPGPSNSFFNVCMLTDHKVEYWVETVKRLKKEFPDRIIIASIACSDKKEDWQELTKIFLDAGVDGFELNLSCPNEVHGEGGTSGGFDTENKIGMGLGTIPSCIKRITEYVKEVAGNKPVYPKLTPNITDIVAIAKGAVDGKAEGIAAINTINGIPKFFPDGTPFPQVGLKKNIISGGLSGDMIRPVALRDIAKIRNSFPNLSILGIGGIWSAYTALQHIYAGANILEVCSSVQRYSFEIVQEMLAGLRFYLYSWSKPELTKMLCEQNEEADLPHKDMVPKSFEKVPNIQDLVGMGAKHVVEREGLEIQWSIVAKINFDKCIQCGKCALSCRDNSTEAITKNVNGIVKINEDDCVGCGLCQSVCPVGAIEFVRVPDKEKHEYHGKLLH